MNCTNFTAIFRKKKEIPYGGFANETNPSFFQKLSRFVRGNFLLPDPRKGWNKYAYRKADELIGNDAIDTVITTGPPHSTHLIGLKLQRRKGIHWIADLRDPWTDIYYYKQFYHTSLARTIDLQIERKVLEKADHLITVSKDLLRLFNKKTNNDLSLKTTILPNGFDEDDFKLKRYEKEEKFTITYTGTISETYDISGFTGALKKAGQGFTRQLKIRFVGKVPSFVSARIKDEFPELELELTGYVDHTKSVEYLLRSDLLLLVIPKVENNEGILTGKFFEYLASGKPVLAIGPANGDLADIIGETKCGHIFDYSDNEGICDFILKIFSSETELKPENTGAYSRKELSRVLSQIIIPDGK